MQDLLENLTLESLSTLLENRSCSTFTAQNSSPEQLTDTEKILAKVRNSIFCPIFTNESMRPC